MVNQTWFVDDAFEAFVFVETNFLSLDDYGYFPNSKETW